MNAEHWRKFLESLEGEKGLPEHFYRLLMSGIDVWQAGDEMQVLWHDDALDEIVREWKPVQEVLLGKTILYVGRRLESRQIPDLKEKVKELVRDAMDAAQNYQTDIQDGVINVPLRELREAFRALCETEKDSKEKGHE